MECRGLCVEGRVWAVSGGYATGTGLGGGKTGIRGGLGTGALGQVRHASIGIAGASM